MTDNKKLLDKKKVRDKTKPLDKKNTVKIDDDFIGLNNKKNIQLQDNKDNKDNKDLLVNNIDLLFSTNKNRETLIKNKTIAQYEIQSDISFKQDLEKYKQEILFYNNKLLSNIIDNCHDLHKYYVNTNSDNDKKKLFGKYLIYLNCLLEYIKIKNLKKIISNELNTFSNQNQNYDDLKNIDINSYDISNLNQNISCKIKNFDNFYVKKNNKKINNFIPKKRLI